jgi:hypothetical protein
MDGSEMIPGRTCTKCKQPKEACAFLLNGTNADGSPRLRSVCRICDAKRVETKPKICKDCKTLKPASAFWKGRTSYCRECMTKRSDAFKRGNGRTKHNARMVAYNRDKHRTDSAFRTKMAARRAVLKALQAGTLQKPAACPHCHRQVRVHGHHHKGYEKPHQLDVEWCCARCHRRLEAK